jgi:hypothetical protein
MGSRQRWHIGPLGPLYPLRQCRATLRRPSRRHSSSSFSSGLSSRQRLHEPTRAACVPVWARAHTTACRRARRCAARRLEPLCAMARSNTAQRSAPPRWSDPGQPGSGWRACRGDSLARQPARQQDYDAPSTRPCQVRSVALVHYLPHCMAAPATGHMTGESELVCGAVRI